MDAHSKLKQAERRQKLAEAMMMGQMAQNPSMGGLHGLVNVLGKMGMGYLANKGMDQTSSAQAAYGDELKSGVEKFMNTYQGQPEQVLPPGMAGPPRPATPGNPRQAIIDAMGSQMPELQAIGQEHLTQLGKGGPKRNVMNIGGKLVEVPDQGAPQQIGDFSEPEYMTVNGKVVNKSDPSKVVADYETKGGDLTKIGGDLYQKMSDGSLKKLDNAPKTTVNVGGPHVNLPGQKKGFEKLAELAAQDFSEKGKTAQNAIGLVGTLNQMNELAKNGIVSGPLADPAVYLQSLAQSAGIPVDKTKLANAENYRSLASDVSQRVIAQYGGNRGVTKEEAAIIQQIVPQLQQSPQARVQLNQILKGVAERNIADYQKAQTNLKKALTAEDMSQYEFGTTFVPNPQPSAPAVQQPQGGGTKQKPKVRNW